MNTERRLFGHLIRKETTGCFYTNKMTIDEFEQVIINHFDAYKQNMKHLGSPAIDDKYIEEWVEQYLAWLEIEEER